MRKALLRIFPVFLAAWPFARVLRPPPRPWNPRFPGFRLHAPVIDPDFLGVASFCIIGLLLVLNLMLRFPEFSTIIAQYNQF
jgi:hypothetical protein